MTSTLATIGRQRLGKAVAVAVAAGLLLAACGGGDDDAGGGAGGGEPIPPTTGTTLSVEDAMARNVDGWPVCEVMGEHLMEFAEAFDYVSFDWAGDSELKENNGSNTGGVMLCYQNALWFDDPEEEGLGDMRGDIMFGFASASQEGDGYVDEEYQTPRGRYDQQLALRREYVNNDPEAEMISDRPIEGPWDEAVYLSHDVLQFQMDAFVLDIEHNFMLSLSVDVGDSHRWDRFGDQMTWTLEEAKTHFLEVTVPNAYQTMLDRLEAAGD